MDFADAVVCIAIFDFSSWFIYGFGMARRIKNKKPKVKNPKIVSAKEIQHYNAVLIENLQSEFKFVIEHVSDIERRINERMDMQFKEMYENFDGIRAILKYHTEMFQKNDKRWEQNEKKLESIDNRLNSIEHKLDQVAGKVEKHDQQIQELYTTGII